MKFCVHCGTQLQDDAQFCGNCGQSCNPQAETKSAPVNNDESLMDKLTGTVNRFAGGSGKVRPPLRKLFSKIFVSHTRQESEEIFVCGTATTTPKLSMADTAWPQPWLFSRIFLAFAVAFAMLHFCCVTFENLNAYPGTIILGSFLMPIAVFVFFFELNTPRNVSFFNTIKIFLVGGCASLLFTLLLFEFVEVEELDYWGAILVGVVEEIGKLAIVAFFIYQEKDAKYAVNGLLIGAAVGAGFAAFESAGYAFRILLGGGYDAMIDNIMLRAVLAPGGHVVWAAMSGYGLMLAKGDKPFTSSCFTNAAFLRVFWMPVAMHSVWDMPIDLDTDIPLIQIGLCVLAWIVILVMINNCLEQIGKILIQQAQDGVQEDGLHVNT